MPADAGSARCRTGTFWGGLCVAILFTLMACQPAPPMEAAPEPAVVSSSETSQVESDLDSPAPADNGAIAPDEASATERQQETTLVLPPPVDDDPERFRAATPATLVAELGEPRLRRQEPPAEVWQYRGQGCVLDFFLYQDAQTFKVVHIEARDLSARSVETRSCLRRLLEARQQGHSS